MFGVIIFCFVAATAVPYNGMYPDYRGSEVMHPDYYQPLPAQRTLFQGIDGNEYKVVLSLPGFEQKDIDVNASYGRLTVNAVHREGGALQNSYMDQRTLPDYVIEKCKWTYTRGVLTIVFPLKSGHSH